jgi:ribosomal protein S8
MSQDIVADCLNQIMNAKKADKKQILIKRSSRLLINILDILKEKGYLGYSIEGKIIKIDIKDLNECKAIKPRYTVTVDMIDKYVRRFLPARDFGFLIISTSKGLMPHYKAIEENTGGCLIAYVF